MTLLKIISFALLISISSLYGQIKKSDNVSFKDLSVTKDDIFKEASAIVLSRDIHLEYGKILYFKERIKIFNREGFDYGIKKINFSDVKSLKAFVYNLINEKIVKTELTSSDIFVENIDNETNITKVVFPNVKEGSILELNYKVDYVQMNYINAQDFIPIKKLNITIENPTRNELRFNQNPISEVQLKLITSSSKYLYTGRNIEPLKDEKFVYNINNYRGKIYIEKFYLLNNRKIKSWNDVAEQFNNFDWFGEELKKSGSVYKNDLSKLISNKTDDILITKAIYFYVQNRMIWNKKYSRGSNNIRKIFIDEKGDTGDINFLLISMLRKAGINANPLLLSTKNNGFIHLPTIEKFNCVIAVVEINDKIYMLDASRKNAGFGELNRDLMNGDGLIIYKDDNYKIVSMKSNKISNRIIIVNSIFDFEELSVKGDVKMRFDNYIAWDFRDEYGKSNEQKYIENLENSFDFLTISNFENKNIDDLVKPISLSYDFIYDDFIEIINGNIYFKPLLYFGITENKLKEKNRKYPINYGNPINHKYIFNYKIPKGFHLKSMPLGKNIIIEDGIGSLKYNINLINDIIQVTLTLNIKESSIHASYYEALKKLFSEQLIISESRIVLSKT